MLSLQLQFSAQDPDIKPSVGLHAQCGFSFSFDLSLPLPGSHSGGHSFSLSLSENDFEFFFFLVGKKKQELCDTP